MNIAFIHYHLKPGGVTRVIQQQINVCEELNWNYCILAGENPLGIQNSLVVPELNYTYENVYASTSSEVENQCQEKTSKIQELVTIIRNSIRAFFSSKSESCDSRLADLIHVHNATLAKNIYLLPALTILAEQGENLFFQLHDFAEDGRPEVYSASPYPASVNYACINSRDLGFLAKGGVPEHRLHYLPNPVKPLPNTDAQLEPSRRSKVRNAGSEVNLEAKYALYPVRGIRRKNLGEVVLLSVLFEQLRIGITLPPNNQKDLPSYTYWEEFARSINASVDFNATKKASFEDLCNKADFFLSTSVQEGFGFAFLEPWTLKKFVLGRSIPYVHKDFINAGMNMDSFYSTIPLPIAEIDIDRFQRLWTTETKRRLELYLVHLKKQGLEDSVQKIRELLADIDHHFAKLYLNCELIDFARLDVYNQVEIIRKVIQKDQLADTIRKTLPQINRVVSGVQDFDILEHNYQTVFSVYSEASYCQRLQSLYKKVAEDEVEIELESQQKLNKDKILEAYLNPANIFLITS